MSDRPVLLWDDRIAGFGVKVLPTGSRKYVLKYRAHGGGRGAAQRWLSLGTHGAITCDQARTLAQKALLEIAAGGDPQREKADRRIAPVFADVWQRFETDRLPLRKAATVRNYRTAWRRYLEPAFGAMKVAEIKRADVDRFHKSLRRIPHNANRVLALCSRLFTLAEAWEWRAQGSNPCRYVERFAETARTRFLKQSELEAIHASLAKLVREGQVLASAGNAIRLLLLTGARLNEVLSAQWEWVDWEDQVIRLPDSKTGAKPIFLSAFAAEVLQAQRELMAKKESPFIFPGRSTGHMINLRKPWCRVCEDAGIEGVRLHDLRHTAASIAAGQGASLPVIGRLLGHTQAQTTLRYAHVDNDPALQAANLIGENLRSSWSQKPKGSNLVAAND